MAFFFCTSVEVQNFKYMTKKNQVYYLKYWNIQELGTLQNPMADEGSNSPGGLGV